MLECSHHFACSEDRRGGEGIVGCWKLWIKEAETNKESMRVLVANLFSSGACEGQDEEEENKKR